MRLSDLRDLRIKTTEGKRLGRVHEVHCDGGKVTALICGAGSFIERLTAKQDGHRIPWECVQRVGKKEVIVDLEPSKSAKTTTASRSRQGTRRPNARRSKR
jgi:sporulation protein YlmC with PRC-barrel domain